MVDSKGNAFLWVLGLRHDAKQNACAGSGLCRNEQYRGLTQKELVPLVSSAIRSLRTPPLFVRGKPGVSDILSVSPRALLPALQLSKEAFGTN